MKNPLRFMRLMLLSAIGMLFACTLGVASESDEEILIGRIAHIEGKLLRYIEENKDWVHTVKDSPFGLDDTLYSGNDAKAEMIMPNKTWLRVGENTQIQLIDLNSDTTTVDVAAGLARLYNKSDDGIIKVTTPFGYVVAPAGTVFDLYVGDESLEVVAVRGNVDFVHENSRVRYEVWEGSSSLIADGKETAQGNGMVDSAWDDWNDNREALWTKRLRNQSTSMNLLPEPLRDQSYVLEENGQWERVHYEGAYHDMWRPTRIERGWRPFTTGRWTVYYGDNCWIPDEPFGYVTHHYGSWVYVESFSGWYWMPPVARFNVGAPGPSISFAWFPGRVGWLHSGPSIGWVPLTPSEVYYGHRRWGRRTVVISSTTVVNINIGRYRYIDEAVIIDRDYFYRGSRYTPHIQRNIGRDVIVNNYRPTTVINNTIINNITIDKRRYTYNDVEVSRKPHTTVINRINDNHKAKQDFGPGNRERIEKDLLRVNAKAEPSPKVELHKPQLSTKLVGSDDIAKPFNALQQERKLIKPKERERPISKDNDQRLGSKGKGEPGQTARPNDQEDKGRSLNVEKEESQRQDNGLKKRQEQLPPSTKLEQGKQQEQLQQEEQIPVPRGDKERRQRNLGETGEARDIKAPEDKPRLKSPRELSNKEDNRPGRKDDQLRQQENTQVLNQQKLQQQEANKQLQEQEIKQQQKEVQRRQEQEILQRQQKDEQGRQQQETQQRQQKDEQRQQQQEVQQRQQKDEQRLKSPRELSNKEDNRAGRKDDQLRQQEMQQRQQKEEQGRQQQEIQLRQQKDEQGRQQQEMQQRQQKEEQGRQQQEMQQRQQKEEQGRQQQEMQLRQQKDEQRRQQQEIQLRQQKDEQGRQQQEMQLRQQKEEQGRQQQEMQQRQQKEEQGRQQQEMQLRQQKDEQRRQQQEIQLRQQKDEQGRQQQEIQLRQQKDEQGRQQQEMQQRQQKDEQRRQQQEVQQRQQKEEQGRQQQEMQQRQKQDHQRQQDDSAKQQEQAVKQKKKKQLEEEQQLKEKQQPPGVGG